mgnify:CR=1 FL=1
MARSSKKNKRMKNRINTLLEININKKRVTTVKKALTTVTLAPTGYSGSTWEALNRSNKLYSVKNYKTVERLERINNQWEAKIAIDQTLQPSNKAYKTVGLLGLDKTYIKREV